MNCFRMPEELNESQRKAVMHGEGPMLVLAGPGSGKTFVITKRISYLIEQRGVDPRNILVITFTREAAMNMQGRFMAAQNKVNPVNFGTFHAIFYQMIKRSGCLKTDAILTDSDKKRMIIPILKDYKKETGETAFEAEEALNEVAYKCLSAFGYYKNTGKLDKAAGMLEEPYKQGFERLLKRYEEYRVRSRKLDYDDMLYQCRSMLESHPDILNMWRTRFQYLLVDEMQDINPIQYEIIRLLAGERGNLFVVGDDDQSIYGFRGSEPSLMRQFRTDYPDCDTVLLNVNYRCRPEIIKASLKVINENKNRFEKNLTAAKTEEAKSELPQVSIRYMENKREQYLELAHRLKQFNGSELNSSAILFRTNFQMQGFATVMAKERIPYVMKEKGKCIYDHFIIQDINHYMMFAGGDRRRSLFLAIMNKPSRYISRDALLSEIVSFEEIRSYYREYESPKYLPGRLLQLGELEDGLEKLAGMKPYLAVQYLRKAMGYEQYLHQKAGTDKAKLSEWMEILEDMSREAREYTDYGDWLEYQEYFRKEAEQKAAENKNDQGVHLMTVHASKGLEFDRVWIPDVNEGIYPYGHMQTKETEEEERRMLYVAMTRAKESLEITFVTGTSKRPRLMSRFLNPLRELCQVYSPSTSSSNSQLSRYSSKASETRSYSSSSSMKPSSGSSLGSSGFSL